MATLVRHIARNIPDKAAHFAEWKFPHHLQVAGEMHLNVDREIPPPGLKKSESLSKVLLSPVTRGSSTGVA